MSKQKKILKSIIGVLTSNISNILAGIIVGFIIPKVISVEGFGFYKTFTLYLTYIGLFSLGIIDGIALEYGGVDYENYDKKFFRSIFRWYLIIHLFWLVLIILIGLIIQDANYSFIMIMVGIYMLFSNVVGYFQQISQITQRFKEYSVAKMIQSGMKLLGGIIVIAIYYLTKQHVDYRIYISLVTFGFVIVSLGYLCIYKEIVLGDYMSLRETRLSLIQLMKVGFPLIFANLCATLILSIDRQFVNLLFTNEEYAIYAFAYNLLSVVTVATSAVSTVLYPVLKRTTNDTLQSNFDNLVGLILVFVFGMLILYFPLCWFIPWFLPKYENSLIIFRIIFPGLAISSSITVVMHNYYKTLGDNIIYFKKSLIVLAISAVANIIAYYAFRSTEAISIASIITMVFWYLFIENYFVNKFGYNRKKNLFYMIIIMSGFYIVTSIQNWFLSGTIYIIFFTSITLIVQNKTIRNLKTIFS